MATERIDGEIVARVREALLRADPEISEIIQFGSSVFAPESALDLDVLVVSGAPKDLEDYWRELEDIPVNVDVIPQQRDAPLSERMAQAIAGAGRCIYGEGEILLEAMHVAPPTFLEAREMFAMAEEARAAARPEPSPTLRRRRWGVAFDLLFHVARVAVMAFLGTEQTRWGQLCGELPEAFASRFKEIIDTLHVQFGYHLDYPTDSPDVVFLEWHRTVTQFIDDLESAAGGAA